MCLADVDICARVLVSTPPHAAFMATFKVLRFGEPTGTATFADGLAFIERTRRQLDRFHALPHAPGEAISPEDETVIRRQCDDLEADINAYLYDP
jgi:hypothetical protein